MRKNFSKNKGLLISIAIILIIITIYIVNKDGFTVRTPTCPVGNSLVRSSNVSLCYNSGCVNAQRKYVKVRIFKGVRTESGVKVPIPITSINDNTVTLISVYRELSNELKTLLVNGLLSLINSRTSNVYRNLSSSDITGSRMVWGFLATNTGVESTTFVSLNNTTNVNLRKGLDTGNITDLYIAACLNPATTTIKLVENSVGGISSSSFFISGTPPTSYARIAT